MQISYAPMSLTLGDVTLRKLSADDNIILSELANNRNVWDNLGDLMPHPYTTEDANRFIAMALEADDQKIFAIEHDCNLAGVIGLTIQKDIFRLSAEIGYWLGEPFWNKGIATKAVRLATHYGIRELGLIRVHAHVFDFNKASQKVLEKAGYRFECISLKAIIKNGRILNDHRYAFIDDYLSEEYLTL